MEDFTTIKEDMLAVCNWYNFLNKKVREELAFLKDYYSATINESVVDCESPIEQLLSLRLNTE